MWHKQVYNTPVTALSLHIRLTVTASIQRRAVVHTSAGVALTRPTDRGDVRMLDLNSMNGLVQVGEHWILKTRTCQCDNITDLHKDITYVLAPTQITDGQLHNSNSGPSGVSCSRTLKQHRYLCWGLNLVLSNKYPTLSILLSLLHCCINCSFNRFATRCLI